MRMRTKVLALVLLVTAPFVAHATALSETCGLLVGDQVTACMAAGRGRYIDPNAASVCRLLVGEQVVNCVRAIADKDYDPDEARACGNLVGEQVVECLRAAGQPHQTQARLPPPPPPEVRAPATATVWLTNQTSHTTIVRAFYRAPGAAWTRLTLNDPVVEPGDSASTTVVQGNYEFCAESTNRKAAYWTLTDVGADGHNLTVVVDDEDEAWSTTRCTMIR